MTTGKARKQDNGEDPKNGTGGSFASRKRDDGVSLPVPRKAGQIGGYETKNYKELSTGAWTATIYHDGKRVLIASNDGRGGANRYDLPPMKSPSEAQIKVAFTKFHVDLKALEATSKKALGADVFEAEDAFMDLVLNLAAIEKHAEKHNFDRDRFMDHQLILSRKNDSYTFPYQGRVDALMRNPELLDGDGSELEAIAPTADPDEV
jgi:hypothetical protein